MSTTDPRYATFPDDETPLTEREERLLRSVVAGYRHDGTPDEQHRTAADPDSPRARDLLTSVLSTPGGGAPGSPAAPAAGPALDAPDRPARRADAARPAAGSTLAGPGRSARRTRRNRLLGLGAGALLLAGAAVVLPNLTGTDRAFATWTRVPTLITDSRAAGTAAECRDNWKEHNDPATGGPMEGMPTDAQLDALQVVIAERRGDSTFAVMAGGGLVADCLATESPVASFLPWVSGSSSASGLSDLPDSSLAPPDGIGMVWRQGSGGSGTFRDESYFESLYAQAGADVVAATLHTAHGDVEASVAGGFLAAWWPVEPDDFDVTLERDIAATLRLRDGRVVAVASLNAVGLAALEASDGAPPEGDAG